MIEPPGFTVLYTIYFSHLRDEWVYAVRLANGDLVMREGSEIGLARLVPEGDGT